MYKNWEQFKKAWVKALRSGRYKRGTHYLVDSEDRFCCLGVAANLLIEAGHRGRWQKEGIFWFFGEGEKISSTVIVTTTVPKWLREVLLRQIESEHNIGGGQVCVQTELARMNDDGFEFKYIADYIEKRL